MGGLVRAAVGTIKRMATVTADDIRVLAQSTEPDAVLALVDDELRVVAGFDVMGGQVVLTKVELVDRVGEDVTDVDAEVMAAGLTAGLPQP